MRIRFITLGLVITLGFITAYPIHTSAQEGAITTIKVESDPVSIPPGNTVEAKSFCPPGKTLVSGGGVCLGQMGTENKILLTVSAPGPDDQNSWFVVCTNMNSNPGQAQAMSWALCADDEVFETEDKKK